VILAAASTSSTKALWYLTRATGLVSLVLLTLVMVLGVVQIQRWTPTRWPRFITAALHRNASLLAVVFLAVHIVTSVADGYAPISIVSVVIPFTSSYRPLWLGLGAVALDLVVALVVTSLLRQRIGHGLWRTLHWAAYACWPIAFVHGLGAGSDGRVGWVQVVDLACLGAVLAALAWRLASNWQLDPTRRAVGALSSAAVVVVVLGWAATGPTQPGWARKAGTPPALLRSTAARAGSSTSATNRGTAATGGALQVPFRARLDGTLAQSGGGRDTIVTIDAVLRDGASGRLQIVLEGTALDDGGLELRQGALTIGPPGAPRRWSGAVTGLAGAQITALVRTAGGASATATVQLQIDPASSRVSGIVDVR
jgi:hypothetical protein